MQDFFVQFTAHIDERKRPENFPKQIYIRETYGNVQNVEQLATFLNKRFESLIKDPGLVVFKDIDDTIDSTAISFDKRVFVPWHMITHFHAEVKPLVNQQKQKDELAPIPEEEKPTKETVN